MQCKPLLSIASLVFIGACQDTSLQEGAYARQSNAKPAEAQETPVDPVKPEEAVPAETQVAENLDARAAPVASTPISVGGAFLFCTPEKENPEEALCQAKDLNLNAFSIPMERAYIVHGSPVRWGSTSFKAEAEAGHYRVKLPKDGTLDFGIAMVYDKNKAIFDWIEGSSPSSFNLVVDGGFENPAIAADQTFLQTSDTSLLPWKARSTPSSGCPDSIAHLEFQNAGVPESLPAIEGKQWLELDAVCTDKALGSVGNMAVYQDLSLKKDHHYLLRFSFARRASDGTNLERMRASIASKTLYESDTLSQAWTTRSFSFTAAQDSQRLEFEELGLPNRLGTLLDNVQIFDMGPVSQVLLEP